MLEQNLSTCRVCGENKERIEDGKYTGGSGRNKRWRDDTGRLWRGRVCPDCHKSEMKERMVKARAKSEKCEAQ